MDPEQLKQAQNDLQEIIANLSSGDPAQIKSAQGKLQALGYDVSPDGQLGPKTSAAVGEFRKFVSDTAERGVRSQETQLDLQRTDPTNRALKMGTEALPYAVGAGVGYGTSQGLKKGFDTADKAMGEAADRLATSRRVSPEAAQDQLRKMQRGRTVRTAGQFLAPATFLGAAEATRDYIAPQFEDPGTREAINLLATGEQAAGITLGAKQMIDLLRRNNPIDPETEAALRSRVEPNRLLRGQPDAPQAAPAPRQVAAPAPSGPAMRHSDRLKQTATAAGAKPGKSKSANVEAIKKNLTAQNMPDVAESLNLPRTANRSTILQRLREISKIGGRYVWPVTAGLVAYDAVTGEAEAGNQPEVEAGTGNVAGGGVTNADRLRGAVTGTAAGATVYGGNRLLQALPQSVKTAFGAGAPMLAPQMGADMTDYTPEETAQLRNWTARNLPAVSQFVGGYPEEAYDMAQVPERNPARIYENAYSGSGYGQPRTHPVTGRPLLQGNGGIATEESITVTHPRLNQGRPTNIPSIWGGQRPPYQSGTAEFEDWAVDQALQSGQQFQPYGSVDEAVSAAKQRSDMLGRTMKGQPAQQPDSFDADIAELQRLLSEMEAEGGQPMPQPQFSVPPPTTGPQNRLLAVR